MARQFLSGSPLSLWSPEKGGFVGCRVWKGGGAGVGKCFHVCMSASHSTSQLAADAFQLPPRKSNRGENTGKWQKERDGHSYSHCHTASWPNPKSKFTFVTSYVGQHTIWARPLSNRRLLRRSSANVLAPCFCVCANYGSLYPPSFYSQERGGKSPVRAWLMLIAHRWQPSQSDFCVVKNVVQFRGKYIVSPRMQRQWS